MDAERTAMAETCLHAAHDGSLGFPEIAGRLIAAAFSGKARAAGCAGYLVSFIGRRTVYFGRTAATHIEHFPG